MLGFIENSFKLWLLLSLSLATLRLKVIGTNEVFFKISYEKKTYISLYDDCVRLLGVYIKTMPITELCELAHYFNHHFVHEDKYYPFYNIFSTNDFQDEHEKYKNTINR